MAPALEPRISLVTLGVSDLAAATRFYEGLGWTPGFHNEEVTFFQVGGLVLGLWRRDAMAKTLGIPEAELVPGGMEVAHNVRHHAEVAPILAAAQAAGGTVLVPAHDTPWGGHSGHFADPDGYRWEVAWNPAWTITKSGATHMG